MKLFRKNIEPSCTYCQRGQQINETDVMCVKHGIVAAEHHCRSFKYDPLKRVPPRPAVLDTAKLKEEDFSLVKKQASGMDACFYRKAAS